LENRQTKLLRISDQNVEKLSGLKEKTNLKTFDGIVSYLLAQRIEEYPQPTIENIIQDSIPIIITGLPGVGKTFFLRNLIPDLECSVFVLDVHNEYGNLEAINLGEFFSLDFNRDRKIRFIPNSNVDISKSEADSIFRHFIMFQKQLSKWLISTGSTSGRRKRRSSSIWRTPTMAIPSAL